MGTMQGRLLGALDKDKDVASFMLQYPGLVRVSTTYIVDVVPLIAPLQARQSSMTRLNFQASYFSIWPAANSCKLQGNRYKLITYYSNYAAVPSDPSVQVFPPSLNSLGPRNVLRPVVNHVMVDTIMTIANTTTVYYNLGHQLHASEKDGQKV